jgi:hypothetical protein
MLHNTKKKINRWPIFMKLGMKVTAMEKIPKAGQSGREV